MRETVGVSDFRRRLILASSSPRRQALLREAGFEFELAAPELDEASQPGETPEAQARRLALLKAHCIAERARRDSCVLAADTLVVLDGCVLGKPRNELEAAQMLLRLAGRCHRVLTGYALVVTGTELCEVGVEESRVKMRPVGPEEAQAYAASGEPLDKAGAYAVQGEGGRFVESIAGSRSNVIGLPLEAVVPRLEKLAVRARCRS